MTSSVLAAVATAPHATADDTVGEPYVAVIEIEGSAPTMLHLEGVSCPPDVCGNTSDNPPENSGGLHCDWRARSFFNGTRHRNGVISGTWSGMYATTDCVIGTYDPAHMGYMYIRATNAFGSATYQTAPATICTERSTQCSGLTVPGNDAGCSACNGYWYIKATVSYRLPSSIGGKWPAPDPDGPCTRSADGRQLDCASTGRTVVA